MKWFYDKESLDFTAKDIEFMETEIQHKLPNFFSDLLMKCNGGTPERNFHREGCISFSLVRLLPKRTKNSLHQARNIAYSGFIKIGYNLAVEPVLFELETGHIHVADEEQFHDYISNLPSKGLPKNPIHLETTKVAESWDSFIAHLLEKGNKPEIGFKFDSCLELPEVLEPVDLRSFEERKAVGDVTEYET